MRTRAGLGLGLFEKWHFICYNFYLIRSVVTAFVSVKNKA
jgi:hypothetical protein